LLSASQWIPQSAISILAAGEGGLELVQSLVEQAAESKVRANDVFSVTLGTVMELGFELTA
jgi:hypothetical protein